MVLSTLFVTKHRQQLVTPNIPPALIQINYWAHFKSLPVQVIHDYSFFKIQVQGNSNCSKAKNVVSLYGWVNLSEAKVKAVTSVPCPAPLSPASSQHLCDTELTWPKISSKGAFLLVLVNLSVYCTPSNPKSPLRASGEQKTEHIPYRSSQAETWPRAELMLWHLTNKLGSYSWAINLCTLQQD